MSNYSLEILNREIYLEEFEDLIIYNFDNYFMREHFKVGKGIEDTEELEHALLFQRILCTDNCTILNYVKDKIEGKLEKNTKSRKKNKKLGQLIKDMQQEDNCTEEEVINYMHWEDNIMW